MITATVERYLQRIRDNIDWINDLMERINEIFRNQPGMQTLLNDLNERLRILNNAYWACTKELKYEPQGNCSLLVNVIKDLKELQDITQDLRNAVRNFLDYIRLLLSLNQNTSGFQKLYGSKLETKLLDQRGFEITEIIDEIINRVIIPASEVFNERAREERGRGITGSQSIRAL
jgi:hypothetical protein